QMPVNRGVGPASARALASAKELLAQGGIFAIYPEGTRSPDGRLYKGHTGIARLALDTNAPVVALAMVGTAEVQPIGQAKPRLFMPTTQRFSRCMRFERGERPGPRRL